MSESEILNRIVFPLSRGSYLFSERPSLEGVHAFLCAKEIHQLLISEVILVSFLPQQEFKTHKGGFKLIIDWASRSNLSYQTEVDISIGVVDVIVYADDIGLFEIGTTRPTKIILILNYIVRMSGIYTVHFWPYNSLESIVFRNWSYR